MLLSDIQPNLDIGLPARHYFQVGNVDELTAALARPPGEYAVDGAAVSARFDWDAIARQTLQIYRDSL
ncbi:Glycosyltransferase [Sphingomonas paucimobilis]|nr:Glycosyltransferase [Sphingomonas paucimobilis]